MAERRPEGGGVRSAGFDARVAAMELVRRRDVVHAVGTAGAVVVQVGQLVHVAHDDPLQRGRELVAPLLVPAGVVDLLGTGAVGVAEGPTRVLPGEGVDAGRREGTAPGRHVTRGGDLAVDDRVWPAVEGQCGREADEFDLTRERPAGDGRLRRKRGQAENGDERNARGCQPVAHSLSRFHYYHLPVSGTCRGTRYRASTIRSMRGHAEDFTFAMSAQTAARRPTIGAHAGSEMR